MENTMMIVNIVAVVFMIASMIGLVIAVNINGRTKVFTLEEYSCLQCDHLIDNECQNLLANYGLPTPYNPAQTTCGLHSERPNKKVLTVLTANGFTEVGK